MATPASDAEVRRRVLAALELVHDPGAELVKVDPARLGPPARAELRRRQDAALRRAWAVVADAYGVDGRRPFYSVHRAGDPRNCLMLCAREDEAARIAAAWPGPRVQVSRAEPGDGERFIALAVALHWRPL